MTDAINYNELMKRARNAAEEIIEHVNAMLLGGNGPDCIEYAQDIIAEHCDWDWTIYYGMAMELCCNVPSDILQNAEEMVKDHGTVTAETDLYSHATMVAYWIVYGAIEQSLEAMIEQQEVA